MRWYYPRGGDARLRVIFAWIPHYWEGTAYWLEWIVVEEVYRVLPSGAGYWRIISLCPRGRKA